MTNPTLDECFVIIHWDHASPQSGSGSSQQVLPSRLREYLQNLTDRVTILENELKNRISMLEDALKIKQSSSEYDVIVIRKPEPLPPRKLTAYWNIYTAKGGHTMAHVHRSKEAADNASYSRRIDCICVEWEEGKPDGVWYSVMERE